MSRDDLRAMLEKIAATAGDPPEHGLDGVAARRRRRTRHRRGAVATAMALAVLGVAVYPRVAWLGDKDHDVTAAETGERSPRAQLPDVVEVRCTPEGIEVPVGSIQPREDGLHVLVKNTMAAPTDVWVIGNSWDSGRIRVEAGLSRQFTQPVPPGPLTVGCEVGGEREQRRVQLVDVDEIYEAPELACADDEEQLTELEPRGIDARSSAKPAVTTALAGAGVALGDGGVEVEYLGGYDERRYSEYTMDPTLEVWAEGDLVAFAHLTAESSSDDRAPQPPWVAVTFEGCSSFLDGLGPGDGTTTQPES